MHHHHRVAIREGDREKVNNKSNIGHALFTFELEKGMLFTSTLIFSSL